jgi:threonine aldolase
MRQAGVLAAAGLVALEQMTARLSEDHANARMLAEGLAQIPGLAIDPARVVTNIVIFDIAQTGWTPAAFTAAAKHHGVLLAGVGGARIRLVTHYDVTRDDCRQALNAIEAILTRREAGQA